MKICIINNLFPPDGGGAERIVGQQIAEERKKGNEVVLVTTSRVDLSLDLLQGVRVYQISPYNLFHYTELPHHSLPAKLLWHMIDMFNICSAGRIKKILKKEKPDVVHTHNLMGIGFLIPGVIRRLCLRHVHTIHDVQLVEPSGVLPWNHEKDSVFQKIYAMIMCWLLGSPNVVVSPSEFLKRFYEVRGFFRGSEWRVESQKSNLRREQFGLELTAERLRSNEVKRLKSLVTIGSLKFLFVGSLTKHKGIDVLMEAWDALDKTKQVDLHVVGSGPLESVVRAWAKHDPRIVVHGQLSGNMLEEVFQACQVLLFSSVCLENRPTVLVEAMERGLYVIASHTGGVEETVKGYDGVVLVEPGDVEVLVREMKNITGATNAGL